MVSIFARKKLKMMLLVIAAFMLCLYGVRASNVIVAMPKEVTNASSAILTCNLTNPSSSVKGQYWTRNEKVIDATKKDTSDLHMVYKLEKIDSSTGGLYTCIFQTADEDLKQTIEVKTMPQVAAYKHSEHGNENDKGVLVCVSHGYPPPTDWTWFKMKENDEKEPIGNSTDKYEIKSTPEKTTLSIMNLNIETDAGKYMCQGSNEFGIAENTIQLRVRSRLAALWPFLGIVVEVIVLITVIFIYEKRRKPDEIGDDDDSGAAPLKEVAAGIQAPAVQENHHVELHLA
ncbi:hypothetical protein GN956_G25140 [Arapaima gigas]